MKLDRNINASGLGKYAIINLRTNRVERGWKGSPEEFFVIKLKDLGAAAALHAYAASINDYDPELAEQVSVLAVRSEHMQRKHPD
jgi:hypothetical protein